MARKEHTKFIWCPVCMVHTYHRNQKGTWECLGEQHTSFLKLRKDPWIEAYKANIERRKIAHQEKV